MIGSETIAALAGLGHRIVNLAENMEMARMFAYIVFVVAIVAFLNFALVDARGAMDDGGNARRCRRLPRRRGPRRR